MEHFLKIAAEVHKKKKRTDKNNYRPVSILSNISKIYERSFYNQMYDYFDSIFSKYNADLVKGTVLSTVSFK